MAMEGETRGVRVEHIMSAIRFCAIVDVKMAGKLNQKPCFDIVDILVIESMCLPVGAESEDG